MAEPEHARRSGRPAPSWLATASEWSLRALIVVVAVYVTVRALTFLSLVVLPLLLAILFSAVLAPPVGWLRKHGTPSLLATWLVFLGAIVVIGGAAALAVVRFLAEADMIGDALARGWERFTAWLASTPLAIEDPLQQLRQEFQQRQESITSWAFRGVGTLLSALGMIVLTLFFTFFLVKDGPQLTEWLLHRFGRRDRPVAREAGARAWTTIGRYFRGVALIATVNAVLTGIALLLIGIPLVVPLMLLTFLGSFIPFVGPVVAALAAGLVGLASGGWTEAALIVAAEFAIQQFEGNVLEPIILGHAMKLHPVAIALIVAAGGIVGGIPGAFLAVPIVSTVIAAIGAMQDDPGADEADTRRAA